MAFVVPPLIILFFGFFCKFILPCLCKCWSRFIQEQEAGAAGREGFNEQSGGIDVVASIELPAQPESKGEPWGGRGWQHPGGDCTDGERGVIRTVTTANDAQHRSSIWAGEYDARSCLSHGRSDRFCSSSTSFAGGRSRVPDGEWIVFDLAKPSAVERVRFINYWSSNDSFSVKRLFVDVANELNGPWRTVGVWGNVPRCSESRGYTLHLDAPVAARFWRLRCTETHGGGGFGIYNIAFFEPGAAGREGFNEQSGGIDVVASIELPAQPVNRRR